MKPRRFADRCSWPCWPVSAARPGRRRRADLARRHRHRARLRRCHGARLAAQRPRATSRWSRSTPSRRWTSSARPGRHRRQRARPVAAARRGAVAELHAGGLGRAGHRHQPPQPGALDHPQAAARHLLRQDPQLAPARRAQRAASTCTRWPAPPTASSSACASCCTGAATSRSPRRACTSTCSSLEQGIALDPDGIGVSTLSGVAGNRS